jgi:hypothetical protein
MEKNKEEINEKLIMNQSYFNCNSYLEIESLKDNTICLGYILEEDKKLEDYCTSKVFKHVLSKKKLFESKNCKNLIRSGVPLKNLRELILKLISDNDDAEKYFKNETFYKDKVEQILKNNSLEAIGDYFPKFRGLDTINESLSVNYLNQNGYLKLKEILWLINSIQVKIVFSPILINVVKLILIICKPGETYFIMKNLIELNSSLNEESKIRWHIRFNYEENDKLILSIMQSLIKQEKIYFNILKR